MNRPQVDQRGTHRPEVCDIRDGVNPFLDILCGTALAAHLGDSRSVGKAGQIVAPQFPRIYQPVEKVVVGSVGDPRGPKYKAKTLPRHHIWPPNWGQKEARRGFSTGCYLPRTPVNKGKRKGRPLASRPFL